MRLFTLSGSELFTKFAPKFECNIERLRELSKSKQTFINFFEYYGKEWVQLTQHFCILCKVIQIRFTENQGRSKYVTSPLLCISWLYHLRPRKSHVILWQPTENASTSRLANKWALILFNEQKKSITYYGFSESHY